LASLSKARRFASATAKTQADEFAGFQVNLGNKLTDEKTKTLEEEPHLGVPVLVALSSLAN
jgi:hypothetical protein